MKREADMNGAETPSTDGSNGGRDASGRFTRANRFGRGNPHARTHAELREVLLAAATPARMKVVVEALIVKAESGDLVAVRELLDRLFGRPHLAIELEADVAQRREYSETERIEAARLARLLLTDGGAADAGEVPVEAEIGQGGT